MTDSQKSGEQTLSSLMTEEESQCFRVFVYELNLQPSKHLLPNDIVLRFTQFLEQRNARTPAPQSYSYLATFLSKTQEIPTLEDYTVHLPR